MKKICLLFAALFSLSATFAQFAGNGKIGFGGPVGNGSLTITDDRTTITFNFQRGTSGSLNDAVVIFIDSRSGGFTSTTNFTDHDDGLRTAISGFDGTNRSVLTFPAAFQPDFAVAFDKGFGGIWELKENAGHNYKNSANLTPPGGSADASNYVLTVNRDDLGLPTGTIEFKFLVTYISETGYRSNEFIGDPGPTDNPANGNYTATGNVTYTSALPVTFSGITAKNVSGNNIINWSVGDQLNADHYEVYHSTDGQDFSSIAKVNASKNSVDRYSYTHTSPDNGINYYRVTMVDKGGKAFYSDVVSVNNAFGNALKVFVNGGNLMVQMNGQKEGNYRLAIVNSVGQPVTQQSLKYNGSQKMFSIALGGQLSSGIYTVIINGNQYSQSQQVLIK